MITFFTTPKPFRGHIGVIQRNAIESWKRIHPSAEVILFGDEEGAAEAAREADRAEAEAWSIQMEGIREDQFCLVLRGGGFFNPGIVPPRGAKRPELSRSMRALRASRINAVFSATPVYSWARPTRSSSSATVAGMKNPSIN